MSPATAHSLASAVSAEAGEVLVDGPDGIAAAMTPDAAEETGRRLIEAAAAARQQLGGAIERGQESETL